MIARRRGRRRSAPVLAAITCRGGFPSAGARGIDQAHLLWNGPTAGRAAVAATRPIFEQQTVCRGRPHHVGQDVWATAYLRFVALLPGKLFRSVTHYRVNSGCNALNFHEDFRLDQLSNDLEHERRPNIAQDLASHSDIPRDVAGIGQRCSYLH